MRSLLILLCLFGYSAATCYKNPPPSLTRFPKSPGDNGFKIIINGDPERYVPGTFYAVTLVGDRTHNRIQQFSRFSIRAEPRDPNAQSTPLTHGQFQLFADTISTFDEECVNIVKEADDLPKTEVQVMWKAPKPGSGCVVIKAMVFENARRWFAEDGQLSRQICEQSTKESQGVKTECCACDEAKYSMVFEGLWSNVTHPKDFPFSLWLTHFSDVIGASHEKNFTFWGEGQIATDGFRSLAEWGSTRIMEEELIQQKHHLKTIIKAAGLWYPRVNTNTSSTFKVDRKRPLISLASMLGPTPDWVVGVSSLDLCLKDCTWIENLNIDLYPYDAGTDSGITYMSPNSETKPREKMFRITTKYPEDPRAPFYDPDKDEMLPLARLYLKRESLIPRNCDEQFLQELTVEVAENSEDTSRPECAVTEYGQWSPCSVTCGKGLRMRSREYTMPPEKVQMFGCNRQLVSKEMCVADVPECEGEEGDNSDQDLDQNSDTSGMCATTDWGPWSECSATCGVGFNMRTRHFLNHEARKKCSLVNTVDKKKCMMPECRPEDTEVTDPNCPLTAWSDWSICSVSCGTGIRLRMRMLLTGPEMKEQCSQKIELVQQAPCTERPDCSIDMATAKQICMEPLDYGLCRGSYQRWAFNTDKKMCVPFTYNGCKGNRNNFMTEDDCLNTCGVVRDALLGNPINPQGASNPEIISGPQIASRNFNSNGGALRQDCMLTEWSEWSTCSVTCGQGYSERYRMIKVEAQNGGTPCPRKLVKRKRCYAPLC